jgi:6-pyruvoyl-tetrahydropterin synthase
MATNIIAVKHNIEVAHRLSQLPGKCENIHGHSMWVKLELRGYLNENYILEGVDFGSLKKDFRGFLDSRFDHHLLLNNEDPLIANFGTPFAEGRYPGLNTMVGDPTTENIAYAVGTYMSSLYPFTSAVEVWETAVNMARWEA